MPGRMLVAEAAAGARMNKAKIFKIAAGCVAAMFLLTAAALCVACFAGPPELRAFFGSDQFLMFCVVTHVTSICLQATVAATARTPAARRYFAESAAACTLHLAVNLYLVLVAGPKKVLDCA